MERLDRAHVGEGHCYRGASRWNASEANDLVMSEWQPHAVNGTRITQHPQQYSVIDSIAESLVSLHGELWTWIAYR